MNEEEIKLLPCPFCGAKQGNPDGPRYYSDGLIYDNYSHIIDCACGIIRCGETKKHVEDNWNTRVKNP
jgi:hypothetical protein